MKILIDARMYGLKHAGIGRYVMNLVNELANLDNKNEYTLLVKEKIDLKSSDFRQIVVDARHYSAKEQVVLPKIITDLNPDLVHFPHFNVPIFWRGKYVLTIHDLTKHNSRGMRTTTRNPLLYWAKYAGYKTVFSSAVCHAQKIIVPSKVVGEDLQKGYDVPFEKIEVIYEGVGNEFQISHPKGRQHDKFQIANKILDKYKIEKPYVIYTGSAYPHKNLENLVAAIKEVKVNLVIASARNVFIERLIKHVKNSGAENYVKFLGYVPDEELVVLYKNAKAFVFPSLAEGFGLPGVEAMASGCPVICSDIPVFHEIYGGAAIYFNPTNITDIADKIRMIPTDGKVREDMGSKGKEQANKYSWRKMAQETLEVYENVLDKP